MPRSKRLIEKPPIKIQEHPNDNYVLESLYTGFTPLASAPVAPLETPPPPPPSILLDVTPEVSPPPHPMSSLFESQRNVNPVTFPKSLQILNPNAWKQLWEHLSTKGQIPAFVHGPTGVGKTRGVAELVTHMGLRTVCLDAVEADDTQQLVTWVRRTREAHTFKRKSVVIIDDMEGFTPNARIELAKLSKDERVGLNPIIFIANARRDPMWKSFSTSIVDIRLFTPRQGPLRQWFKECYKWTCLRTNTDLPVTDHVLDTFCSSLIPIGDIRRIAMALETQNQLDVNLSLGHDRHITNTFDASRKLILGEMPPCEWATITEPRDATLLQFHATRLALDIDRLADCLDTFSHCDTMMPDRFEVSNTQSPMTQLTQASAIQIQLERSIHIGALFLPPRITRTSRRDSWDMPVGLRTHSTHN